MNNFSAKDITTCACFADFFTKFHSRPIAHFLSLIFSTIFYCSIPGRYEAMLKEIDYVKLLWKNRQEVKVENLGIAALFGLECYAWYCAGEIVGRGFTFTGYYP